MKISLLIFSIILQQISPILGVCTGGDSCCSASNKCGPMEGDCDGDTEQCIDGYTCGTDNCPKGGTFEDGDDCCMKDVKKSSSMWNPLGEGEGDCDPGWQSQSPCKKGLTCGVNNCRYMWRDQPELQLFASNDDCCFDKTLWGLSDSVHYTENAGWEDWSGVSDWPWGPTEFCGGKESLVRNGDHIGVAGYATKFSLKIEGKQLLGDDTAANALCLYCTGGDYICSKIGEYGDWYYSSVCAEGFTDARVKNEDPLWKAFKNKLGWLEPRVGYPWPKDDNDLDDTAINNVHLQCGLGKNQQINGKNGTENWFSTDGPDLFGKWHEDPRFNRYNRYTSIHSIHSKHYTQRIQSCDVGSVVCGIQAVVEDEEGGADDLTGLQGFSLFCCKKDLLVCEPYEQHACYMAALKNGYTHGIGKYEFASEDYGTKGCYGYTYGDNKGAAFFGKGGSLADKKKPVSGTITRIPGFDCKT